MRARDGQGNPGLGICYDSEARFVVGKTKPMNHTLDARADLPPQVSASLAAAITGGEFQPTDRLPSEHALAAAFDVSRPTVREALADLRARGLIETRRGAKGGAFVREADSEDQVNEIAGVFLRHSADWPAFCADYLACADPAQMLPPAARLAEAGPGDSIQRLVELLDAALAGAPWSHAIALKALIRVLVTRALGRAPDLVTSARIRATATRLLGSNDPEHTLRCIADLLQCHRGQGLTGKILHSAEQLAVQRLR